MKKTKIKEKKHYQIFSKSLMLYQIGASPRLEDKSIPSPLRKKYLFFQSLFKSGVLHINLSDSLLGTKLYMLFDFDISKGL